MNNHILVSVIIPFYSGKEWLNSALESVFNQTHKNIEVILINDGSRENIDDLLEKYPSINYTKIENSGPAYARNLGINLSTGDYICFQDADDLWLDNKIEKQLDYLIINDAKWGITGYQFFDHKTNKHLKTKNEYISGNVFQKFLFSCNIATPTVMIRTEILKNNKTLRFIENTRFGEDTLLWFNMLSLYPLHKLNKKLTLVRVRGGNASKMASIQLRARHFIYIYLKNENFTLNGKKVNFVARTLYYFSSRINKINPKNNEFFSRLIYLPVWLLFKLFYKLF